MPSVAVHPTPAGDIDDVLRSDHRLIRRQVTGQAGRHVFHDAGPKQVGVVAGETVRRPRVLLLDRGDYRHVLANDLAVIGTNVLGKGRCSILRGSPAATLK